MGKLPGLSTPVVPPNFTPARPIVYLDASWVLRERDAIYHDLQTLTDDGLRLTPGGEVYSNGRGGVRLPVGTRLLRGVQHPDRRTFIIQAATMWPMARINDTDKSRIDVELNLEAYHFFTKSGVEVIVSVERAPTYIVLAHELVHAYHLLRNSTKGGSEEHHFFDDEQQEFHQTVDLEELATCGMLVRGNAPISENAVRQEHALRNRKSYASLTEDLEVQGVRPVGQQPTWWPRYPRDWLR